MTALALRTIVRDMANPVHDRIRKRLEALQMTPRQASLKAGGSADLLRSMLRREDALPSGRSLANIADVLKTTEQWILTGHGPEEAQPLLQPADAQNGVITGLAGADPTMAVNLDTMRDSMPQNLPVFGTAAGSFAVKHEGAFEMEARVIEYVRRPPALMSVPDAYAFYVTGGSMAPQHMPGDLRFVHPHKPARFGDSVVVQARYAEHRGVEAFIAHFVRQNAENIVVAKLSPPAEVSFEARYVQAVHRVLTLNELFGV